MYYCRIGVWISNGINVVEGVFDVGDLVMQCVIYCIFQCVMIRGDWYDFGFEQVYMEYVGLLMFNVMCVYVDYILQVKFGIDGGGGDVVLIGIGFGDDLCFVYVVCQNDLIQYVVDFVCVGVIQFIMFEIDFCIIEFFGYVLCVIER